NILQTLRQQKNMTIVLVEQDSERVAEFSDRVIVLHQGQVEFADTPARVLTQIGRLRELGISVPQVTELAACLTKELGTPYHFIRFDEALETLRQQLQPIV